MSEFYRGFIRNESGCWTGTNDDKQLVAADPDAVKYVSTVEELAELLRAEFPDVDVQYGVIHFYGDSVLQHDSPKFYPLDSISTRVTYSDRDLNVFQDLARRLGRAQRASYYPNREGVEQGCAPGFIMTTDLILCYDPKRYAQRQQKKLETVVSNGEVSNASQNLILELFPAEHPRTEYADPGMNTLNICQQFLGRWYVAVQAHGVTKARRTKAITKLVARWKANPKINAAKFRQPGWPETDTFVRLVDAGFPVKLPLPQEAAVS